MAAYFAKRPFKPTGTIWSERDQFEHNLNVLSLPQNSTAAASRKRDASLRDAYEAAAKSAARARCQALATRQQKKLARAAEAAARAKATAADAARMATAEAASHATAKEHAASLQSKDRELAAARATLAVCKAAASAAARDLKRHTAETELYKLNMETLRSISSVSARDTLAKASIELAFAEAAIERADNVLAGSSIVSKSVVSAAIAAAAVAAAEAAEEGVYISEEAWCAWDYSKQVFKDSLLDRTWGIRRHGRSDEFQIWDKETPGNPKLWTGYDCVIAGHLDGLDFNQGDRFPLDFLQKTKKSSGYHWEWVYNNAVLRCDQVRTLVKGAKVEALCS